MPQPYELVEQYLYASGQHSKIAQYASECDNIAEAIRHTELSIQAANNALALLQQPVVQVETLVAVA